MLYGLNTLMETVKLTTLETTIQRGNTENNEDIDTSLQLPVCCVTSTTPSFLTLSQHMIWKYQFAYGGDSEHRFFVHQSLWNILPTDVVCAKRTCESNHTDCESYSTGMRWTFPNVQHLFRRTIKRLTKQIDVGCSFIMNGTSLSSASYLCFRVYWHFSSFSKKNVGVSAPPLKKFLLLDWRAKSI